MAKRIKLTYSVFYKAAVFIMGNNMVTVLILWRCSIFNITFLDWYDTIYIVYTHIYSYFFNICVYLYNVHSNMDTKQKVLFIVSANLCSTDFINISLIRKKKNSPRFFPFGWKWETEELRLLNPTSMLYRTSLF